MRVDPSARRPLSLTWNNLHFNEGRCLHSPRGSRGLRPLFPRILVSIYLYQSLISPFTPLKRKSKPLGEAIYQETPRKLLSNNRGWSCSIAPLTLDFEDGSENGSKVKVAGLRAGKSELRPFISLPTFWLKVITICMDLDGQRVELAVTLPATAQFLHLSSPGQLPSFTYHPWIPWNTFPVQLSSWIPCEGH